MAFGVASCAGVAIPVPGAPDPIAGLQHLHRKAEPVAQANQLIQAGEPCSDDHCVKLSADSRFGCRTMRHNVCHLLSPFQWFSLTWLHSLLDLTLKPRGAPRSLRAERHGPPAWPRGRPATSLARAE